MSVPNEQTQELTKAREPDATVQTNIEFEVSINTENFPPINIQKFPVGLKGLGFLDSHFPLF